MTDKRERKTGDFKNRKLAAGGLKRIEWANRDMPVLQLVRERFQKELPLKGLRMSCCMHVTAETANLVRTLKAGGADVVLCASNPLSTQDDVAAAVCEKFEIPTFAIRGEDRDTYYEHMKSAAEHKPQVTLDDGADLVSFIHDHPGLIPNVMGSMEETTTGVIRLRAMHKDGALKFPVVAVNDADTKHLFDNRYGTGQSTVDAIVRATDVLLAGKQFVVAGYGWCGRGLATRARGMGAIVTVTEVDPLRALEAAMDGFMVMPMSEAARIGDIFCTVTGDVAVLRKEHFSLMKDGAVVCNSGHFNVELNIPDLESLAVRVNKGIRNNIDEYVLAEGRSIHLLAEGRLVNLAAAEGHPASVMDMSFATQALTTEYVAKNHKKLKAKVYDVPREIDVWVASLKLKSMGIEIDTLTPEQEKYLSSWEMGT